MFKRRDTKLIVENWRRFINENEENETSINKDEYIKNGLLEEEDGSLDLVPFRRFVKRVESKNIMSIAKQLILDIIANKIEIDDKSNFKKFREFVGITRYFYDKALEKHIYENKSDIENVINLINTKFKENNPRSMQNFREENVIPRFKELINKLFNSFKENYINNQDLQIKGIPNSLEEDFPRRCLGWFAYISENNNELSNDLKSLFRGMSEFSSLALT